MRHASGTTTTYVSSASHCRFEAMSKMPLFLSLLFSVCLSGRLSTCLSVRLSTCLSVRLSTCLSVRLSTCLSVRLSICPSVRLSVRWLSVLCTENQRMVRILPGSHAAKPSVCATDNMFRASLAVESVYSSVVTSPKPTELPSTQLACHANPQLLMRISSVTPSLYGLCAPSLHAVPRAT